MAATTGEFLSDSTDEPPGTIFYLAGATEKARSAIAGFKVVEPHSLVPTTDKLSRTALRVALPGKHHPLRTGNTSGAQGGRYLLRIGNAPDNDVVVDDTNSSQCNFCFNGTSGELLMYDARQNPRALTRQEYDKSIDYRQTILINNNNRQHTVIVLGPSAENQPARTYHLKMSEDVAFKIYPPLTYTKIPVQEKEPFFADGSGIEAQWPRRGQGFVEYTEIQMLGSGAESDIKLVAVHGTGSCFALKEHKFKHNESKPFEQRRAQTVKQLDALMDEANKVEASNIVPCLHYQFLTREIIQIFMPVYWCSLEQLIDNGEFNHPKPGKYRAARMLRDISLALHCLDSLVHRIVHRDIKPGNILYRNDTFYLADFGVAKVVDGLRTNVGTSFFKAPEVQSGHNHTAAMDIFSLGLTLASCLRGQKMDTLQYGIKKAGANQNHALAERTPSDWAEEARHLLTHDHRDLEDTVHTMLEQSPEKRPTAEKVALHIASYLCKYQNSNVSLPTEEEARSCAASHRTQELQPTVTPAQNSPLPNTHSDNKSLIPPPASDVAVPKFQLAVSGSPAVREDDSGANTHKGNGKTLALPVHDLSSRSSLDGRPSSSNSSSKTARLTSRIGARAMKFISLPKRQKGK